MTSDLRQMDYTYDPRHWLAAMAKCIDALALADNYQANADRRKLIEALIAAEPRWKWNVELEGEGPHPSQEFET